MTKKKLINPVKGKSPKDLKKGDTLIFIKKHEVAYIKKINFPSNYDWFVVTKSENFNFSNEDTVLCVDDDE
jgi:hypothetical protein